MKNNGSTSHELIESHRYLVEYIVQKLPFFQNYPRADLLEFGMEGLCEAAARFDFREKVSFKTFAFYRIKGAILDGIRKELAPSKRKKTKEDRLLRVCEGVNTYLASNSPPPLTDRQKSRQYLHSVISDVISICLLSENMGGIQPRSLSEESPHYMAEQGELAVIISRAMGKLPGEERAVLQKYYWEGLTLDEIGETLNCSKSWISRLHHKAIQSLRHQLIRLKTEGALDSG